MNLKSKFELSYQFVLKTIYNHEFNIENYIQDTLIDLENQKLKNSEEIQYAKLIQEKEQLFNQKQE